MTRIARICVLLSLSQSAFAEVDSEWHELMSVRYAPYADWEQYIPLISSDVTYEKTWKTAATIREESTEDLPLAGLKLALDPGHIGGKWAKYEGREFRIAENDYFVREGELVLEVAQVAAERLRELGAEVVLVRDGFEPVNPKRPIDYAERRLNHIKLPDGGLLVGLERYLISVRDGAIYDAIVIGELVERARLLNEVIQPDAVLSLHMNAAPWPSRSLPEEETSSAEEIANKAGRLRLVNGNHLHMLIFGCAAESEMRAPHHVKQLLVKLRNGSGPKELDLAKSLAGAFEKEMGLPPSLYSGKNAVLPDPEEPYVWARNLMLLRTVECPVVLLEPYVVNSKEVYARIQSALKRRAEGESLADDDILMEYASAVVAGVVENYGPGDVE